MEYFIVFLIAWSFSLYGAFLIGQWWQRRWTQGLSKKEIIELGKQIVTGTTKDEITKATVEYDELLSKAKAKAEEINHLRKGGG